MLGAQIDRTKLQALANELAKDIKTEADLNSKWLKAALGLFLLKQAPPDRDNT